MTFASRIFLPFPLSLGLLALTATGVYSAQAAETHVAPAITAHGKNLGLEAPSTQLRLTVWLNLHNKAELDARVKDIYTEGSSSYHKWLTNADLKAYMPTAAELETVKKELAAHNLKVTLTDPMNLTIHFTGKVSDVESAFNTQISRYSIKDEVVHTTSSEPRMNGAAAGLVQHLGGVNSLSPKPLLSRVKDMRTGQPLAGIPTAEYGKPNGVVFSSQCFYAPETLQFTGVNASDGVTPVSETLTGLTYGSDPANKAKGSRAPCGYSPAQVQAFYGMQTAYGRGYAGQGQTIVIVDVGLNDQALTDGNVFNQLTGLPAFTTSNYAAYNPEGVTFTGANFGTDVETDLDVQWAHAIAPQAKIALVQTFGDNVDLEYGVYYAAQNNLGSVISLSYGEPEAYTGPLNLSIFGEVAELVASKGISLQVSTGDDGDFSDYGIGADVNGFASSPYDTAVGGTSITTVPATGEVVQAGWGNNLTFFTQGAGSIYDPPTDQGFFYAGSGGGASSYFGKPSYQSALPGAQRLLPDVSALADPFTGAEFVTDFGGATYVDVVGGTSLAAPIFSAMWAIMNQYAGVPLGNAAPYLALTPYPLLTDVLPVNGPANVTAAITDPSGTTTYSSTDLFQPLGTTSTFATTIWQQSVGDYIGLSFGTDTSLAVTQGWDNVTGWGTPNMGLIFSVLP